MKIGILTYHRAHNYGAALQAYAMQVTFSRYGEVELIDYWPEYRRGQYDLFDFRFFTAGLSLRERVWLFRRSIRLLVLFPIRFQRHRKFKSFMKMNCLFSEETIESNIAQLPQTYDVYVYGSDQIWRVNVKKDYPLPYLTYLGDRVSYGKKKIAYAASMGNVKYETLQDPRVRSLLKALNAIGVREKDLQEALEKICMLPATHVLDPTFLVARDLWVKLAESSPSCETGPYLLYYSLIDTPQSRSLATKLSQRLGLSMIEINGFESIKGVFKKKLVQTAGPIDFLRLIHNATVVVSTSFHGVVFSLIFRKQFYACLKSDHAGRVASLLHALNLSDRLVNDSLDLSNTQSVDYATVDSSLDSMIEQSRKFIDKALS